MAVKSQSAQKFVPIKDVRDGVVILNDNSMRMVLIASSINFALKSDDEQAAVLGQFQSFLNSLEYTTQILIQSRRLDIKPYLSLLEERLKEPLTELMRIQIQEYIEFIRQFTEQSQIMTKSFFIIIPYSTTSLFQAKKSSSGGASSLLSQFMGGKKKDGEEPKKEEPKAELNMEAFEEARSQLEQRANVVKQGLARTGVRVAPLGTEEIIELYYKFFNPPETDRAQKV